jgi:hypothetical protein
MLIGLRHALGVPTVDMSCSDEGRQMESDRHMSFLEVGGGEVDWLGAAATRSG